MALTVQAGRPAPSGRNRRAATRRERCALPQLLSSRLGTSGSWQMTANGRVGGDSDHAGLLAWVLARADGMRRRECRGGSRGIFLSIRLVLVSFFALFSSRLSGALEVLGGSRRPMVQREIGDHAEPHQFSKADQAFGQPDGQTNGVACWSASAPPFRLSSDRFRSGSAGLEHVVAIVLPAWWNNDIASAAWR